ncbi:hypothetical protein Q8A67_020069 [Cirrhinus molitorella]|uniref:Uncharacterized protein n=1 Tax=Cirrhinus molitorella TaxID=172907 RepID=A0AA88TCH7_9TELE|nr:hypothetical protein Q8A67_020069 [Cirrhinus molitorella]
MSPGTSRFSVSDLLPLTKREVCVTVKNLPPRDGQRAAFMNRVELSARLTHTIVAVCALVLAVHAGMRVCTSDTRMHCSEPLYDRQKKRCERQETFISLQAAGDEGLCGNSAEITL